MGGKEGPEQEEDMRKTACRQAGCVPGEARIERPSAFCSQTSPKDGRCSPKPYGMISNPYPVEPNMVTV